MTIVIVLLLVLIIVVQILQLHVLHGLNDNICKGAEALFRQKAAERKDIEEAVKAARSMRTSP